MSLYKLITTAFLKENYKVYIFLFESFEDLEQSNHFKDYPGFTWASNIMVAEEVIRFWSYVYNINVSFIKQNPDDVIMVLEKKPYDNSQFLHNMWASTNPRNLTHSKEAWKVVINEKIGWMVIDREMCFVDLHNPDKLIIIE